MNSKSSQEPTFSYKIPKEMTINSKPKKMPPRFPVQPPYGNVQVPAHPVMVQAMRPQPQEFSGTGYFIELSKSVFSMGRSAYQGIYNCVWRTTRPTWRVEGNYSIIAQESYEIGDWEYEVMVLQKQKTGLCGTMC